MLCHIEEVLNLIALPIYRKNLTVLLVEDSSVHQILLSFYLRQIGHTVVVTCDQFEALTKIQQIKNYDVLLLDCQHSVINGIELTRMIRIQEKIDGVGTTIIGFGNHQLSEKSCEAGMDDFFNKPGKTQIINAVLGHWLTKKCGIEQRDSVVD